MVINILYTSVHRDFTVLIPHTRVNPPYSLKYTRHRWPLAPVDIAKLPVLIPYTNVPALIPTILWTIHGTDSFYIWGSMKSPYFRMQAKYIIYKCIEVRQFCCNIGNVFYYIPTSPQYHVHTKLPPPWL